MNLANVSTVLRVIIDTTRRCNLHCWYCHSTSGPKYLGPEIDPICIPEVFDTAEQLKVFEITVTGGEPTLWGGLPLLMEESHRLKFTQLQLITNATTISSQMIEMLRRANLSRVCVSLDSIESIHARNRGPGMYKKAIIGIQKLREAVDNITAISVLDNLSYLYWPKLTEILFRLGVKQHHLAPVCFAGNAMDRYQGLNAQQFIEVREAVDRISASLPDGFLLAFNDSLVNDLPSRSMTLATFTERFKGWHIIIRPTGLVNTSVMAWGRSWRATETVGDINQTPLAQLLKDYGDKVKVVLENRFSQEEEVKRKFHLRDVTEAAILGDTEDVQNTEKGYPVGIPSSQKNVKNNNEVESSLTLGISLEELTMLLINSPSRYRLRRENGFALLFDTVTFNVWILNNQETSNIEGAYK